MKIFLDDQRDLPIWAKDWVLVRTYDECIELLKTTQVEEISLDHDLGTEKTGYDIVKYLEERVMTTDYKIRVYCHSANPIGRNNIVLAIHNINKHLE